MKVLKITKREQFELPYESLLNRPRGYSLQESRLVAKMLDQFEALGMISETSPTGVTLFTAKTLPCEIQIEDAPFALLRVVFEEILWTGQGVRRAVAISTWLEEIAKDG